MQVQGIVLNSSHYAFKNDANEDISGMSIFYMLTDTLEPTSEDDQGFRGYASAKATLPLELLPKLQEVPGIYDFELEMRMNKKTLRGEMAISNLTFKDGIEMAVIYSEQWFCRRRQEATA
jgi:hypothetical protein